MPKHTWTRPSLLSEGEPVWQLFRHVPGSLQSLWNALRLAGWNGEGDESGSGGLGLGSLGAASRIAVLRVPVKGVLAEGVRLA